MGLSLLSTYMLKSFINIYKRFLLKISVNSPCPCGSSKKLKKCCKLFHNGLNASNALELMKSRYSAYVVGDSKYIMKTTHEENPDYTEDKDSWSESIKEFSKNSEFNGLVILEFIDGENEAYVTFKVLITQHGNDVSFVEKSKFFKINGLWLYHSGVID